MWKFERSPPTRDAAGRYVESRVSALSAPVLLRCALGLVVVALFWQCVKLAEVDPVALVAGLPRLANWAAKSWPPYLNDLDVYWYRAAETVAIATVATVAATILAFPLSIFISRNMTPSRWLSGPVRVVINCFRGVDTIVFALLFVAAVGLGPFAGVLGMIVHSLGVIAKLNSEAIETAPAAPLEAAAMTGASRSKIVSFALLPSVMPNLASVSLYVWEANVRTSTILGIVGAGGIGIEIKAAIDLLDFPKLLTVTVIMLIMVSIIDQISGLLRRRLA